MRRKSNPEVNVGDRIVLYHMEDDPNPITPGTEGTVLKISSDPFDPEGKIINVEWDDNRTLSLLNSVDIFRLVKKQIKEDQYTELFIKNKDLFKYFDIKFFKQYLNAIRDSGIINMFGASPLLYCGRDYIERQYMDDREDDEDFQKVLDLANESKDKFVSGLLNFIIDKKGNVDDIGRINALARRTSSEILHLCFSFTKL